MVKMEARKRFAPDTSVPHPSTQYDGVKAADSMVLRPLEIPPLGREDGIGSIGSSGFPSSSSAFLGASLRRHNSTSSNISARSDDAASRGSQRSRSTGRSASPSLLEDSDAEGSSHYKRRKDNPFDRPMLENSLESISALFSSGDFPRVSASDREDVINIYNRRMATRLLRGSDGGVSATGTGVSDEGGGATQYAMLRAWVQDDPDRSSQLHSADVIKEPTGQHSRGNRPAKEDPLEEQLRSLIGMLHQDPAAAGYTLKVESGSDVATKDLLAEHVSRGKKIMDISRMIRAVRYARLRRRLRDKGVPSSRLFDRVLQAHVAIDGSKPTSALMTPNKDDIRSVCLLDLCRTVK